MVTLQIICTREKISEATAAGERQIVVSPSLPVLALGPSKLFYWDWG